MPSIVHAPLLDGVRPAAPVKSARRQPQSLPQRRLASDQQTRPRDGRLQPASGSAAVQEVAAYDSSASRARRDTRGRRGPHVSFVDRLFGVRPPFRERKSDKVHRLVSRVREDERLMAEVRALGDRVLGVETLGHGDHDRGGSSLGNGGAERIGGNTTHPYRKPAAQNFSASRWTAPLRPRRQSDEPQAPLPPIPSLAEQLRDEPPLPGRRANASAGDGDGQNYEESRQWHSRPKTRAGDRDPGGFWHSKLPDADADRVDQVTQLLVERTSLQSEIAARERKYEALLKDAQDLVKEMRVERENYGGKIRRLEEELAREREERDIAVADAVEAHISRQPPLPFGDIVADDRTNGFAYRRTSDEIQRVFAQHDDAHFRQGCIEFESTIKSFVLHCLREQKEVITSFELSPQMEQYLQRHDIEPAAVFYNRDLRTIVCRGFIMSTVLERVFRCFLFGLRNSEPLREAFVNMATRDLAKASRWAATVAKNAILSNMDYRPENATARLVDELRGLLECFIDFDVVRTDARPIIEQAVDLARDCRLCDASFAVDLPAHRTAFDEVKMDSHKSGSGRVFVAFAPTVIKRDLRGIRDGTELTSAVVLCKARVWRESVWDDLQRR